MQVKSIQAKSNRVRSAVASLCALAVMAASVPALAMPFGGASSGTVTSANSQSDIILVGQRRGNYNRRFRKPRYGHKYRRHNQRRRHRGRNYRHYGYNNSYRYNDGLGVVLGLAGIGLGLAIANSYNQPYYSQSDTAGYCPAPGTTDWHNFCLSKYRSYVPATGMYTRYSGQKAYCVCP
jgi:hypothetical protein